MAVYEHAYRPYEGPLTPARWRFLILPRYAYGRLLRSRFFLAFFALSMVLPVVAAILIYLRHNATALTMLRLTAGDLANMFPIDRTFFLVFLGGGSWLASLAALFIGPSLISPDLVNNGMPLYLSRPFTRWEYILGKFCVLALLMSAMTWAPYLLLFLFQSYLEGWSWLADNLHIARGIVLGSGIWILLLSLMTMAASAWVKRKPVAAALVLAFFFVARGMGAAINEIYSTVWGGLIDLGGLTSRIWADLFEVQGVSGVPLWACWVSLLAFCSLCLWLLNRKLTAYSVVR